MRRVFVTGATGRVGTRLVPRLLARGLAVRMLVRDPGAIVSRDMGEADIVEGTLADETAIRKGLEGADAVVHLAAARATSTSEREFNSVNLDATVMLGEAAVTAGVRRFVFTSTYFVYGPGRGRPAREDDPTCPVTTYSRSKLAAENALRRLHRDSGLDLRVLRLALVYGDGDPHLGNAVIRAHDWPAHRRLHLVHHADVGQAVVLALRTAGIGGRTFNVADDAPMTAAELCRLGGSPPSGRRTQATGPDDPWAGIIDTTRLRADLGFRPIFPSLYTAQDADAL